MSNAFLEKLRAVESSSRRACIGLDTDTANEKFPPHLLFGGDQPFLSIIGFNRSMMEATAPVAGMYKPNEAFYKRHGQVGIAALEETFKLLRDHAPSALHILDMKSGDIGNTNIGYIEFAFERCRADAVTINPYMGAFDDPKKPDGLQMFLNQTDKGIIVLCRTSNKGADVIQDKTILVPSKELDEFALDQHFSEKLGWSASPSGYVGMPMYQYIALLVSRKWNKHGNCALVVGANNMEQLKAVRILCPTIPILLPAFGAQMEGKQDIVEETIWAGVDSEGGGIIPNNSRSIIFASSGTDFAEAAGRAAKKFNDDIVRFVASKPKGV